jgi:hypothetical protein
LHQISQNVDGTTVPYRMQQDNANNNITNYDVTRNDQEGLVSSLASSSFSSSLSHNSRMIQQQSGNPQINQQVQFESPMTISINNDDDSEMDIDILVQNIQEFLQQYLEQQFQHLVDIQQDEYALTTPILNLKYVDLSVWLQEFPDRQRVLLLQYSTKRFVHTILPSFQYNNHHQHHKHNIIQERSLQVSSQLVMINVTGTIAYSIEVDGGSPIPHDLHKEWRRALGRFLSQPHLDEAMADGGVEGVIRVDQVSLQSWDGTITNKKEENEEQRYWTTTNSSTNNNATTIPWQNTTTSTTTSFSSTTSNNTELTRPSTLSIIFGFVLTGIATLGLVGYGYLFYRKRKKYLRKKRQRKESIAYPAMTTTTMMTRSPFAPSPAKITTATTATSNVFPPPSPSRGGPTSSGLPGVLPQTMILTPVGAAEDTFSEDTSYKGLESSLGSEDASDAFAKELQKAASLDQQAWDEYQRRKEAWDINTNQSIPTTTPNHESPTNIGTGSASPVVTDYQARDNNKNNNINNKKNNNNNKKVPQSLLGTQNLSSDEEGMLDYPEGIETDLEGKPSVVRSYPYGDERIGKYNNNNNNNNDDNDEDDDDEWVENPRTLRSQRYHVEEKQWEPYSSALPTSADPIVMEEKKDEMSPSGFFAKELQNIERDLVRFGGKPGTENTTTGDTAAATVQPVEDGLLSNMDIMSELEELSKYVRRYEQRKSRKVKREMEVLERAAGVSSMSIGMDGQVYNPYSSPSNLAPSTPSSASTISSMAPSQGRVQGSDLPSYAESYLNTQPKDGTNNGNLSLVSDDDDNDDRSDEYQQQDSILSQRLGISPFTVSQPDDGYYSSYSNAGKSAAASVNPTVTTRGEEPTSTPDDYRYSVAYAYDTGSNKNGKNTETSLTSMSSIQSPTRLSNLRANDAIIDSSNSEINVVYDPYTNRSAWGSAMQSSINYNSTTNKRSGLGRFSFRNDVDRNANVNTISQPIDESLQTNSKLKKTNNSNNNSRFDLLRGMFEQKSTEQPAPIYPPGEHWQFEGHMKTSR